MKKRFPRKAKKWAKRSGVDLISVSGKRVRVYENSPGMVPNTIPTVPAEWAELFADAVKKAVKP